MTAPSLAAPWEYLQEVSLAVQLVGAKVYEMAVEKVDPWAANSVAEMADPKVVSWAASRAASSAAWTVDHWDDPWGWKAPR